MKFKYIKIIFVLIGFYSLHLLGITNNIKSNFIEQLNLRFLSVSKINYDKSSRTDKDDLKSIEICENSDFKYFYDYITGFNVTFDEYIDPSRAVSNYLNYKIFFYFIESTYCNTSEKGW